MRRIISRSRRLLYHLYHLLWQGLDLLLPPSCAGCGRSGYRWCPTCRSAVVQLAQPLCESCGQPSTISPCGECRTYPPRFSVLRSWASFEHPVRSALHRLKYRRDIGLGEALVPQLAEYVRGLGWRVDLLVPVPLGAGRLSERGYNQVGLISWPLSLALDLDHEGGAVRRIRETSSQVGLNSTARHENVRDAFVADPGRVKGRTILLLDDVATTGATLSSCAQALIAAGAQDVFALTVARAVRGLRAGGADRPRAGASDGTFPHRRHSDSQSGDPGS